MSDGRSSLEQHLQLWAEAYGPDLAVPRGQAEPRRAAPPAAEAAAPQPAAATPAAATPAAATPAEPAPPPRQPSTAARPARPAEAAPQPAAEEQDEAVAALRALRSEVLPCTRCKLHMGRRMTVFGEGNPHARVMFIGEAPGAKEDQSGRPFVGPAGQLLDRIIEGAMGLRRQDVFIANINKCRPPNNRAPEADEVAACLPFLKQQVEIVRPEVLVCLGRTAAQNLLGSTESTTAMRRRQHEYADTPVIVTWHPAYLLREPSRKRETWEDIKKVNKLLGLPEVPPTKA
jgi:DNA polymerase